MVFVNVNAHTVRTVKNATADGTLLFARHTKQASFRLAARLQVDHANPQTRLLLVSEDTVSRRELQAAPLARVYFAVVDVVDADQALRLRPLGLG